MAVSKAEASSPGMMRIVVDLPAPFRPGKPVTRPGPDREAGVLQRVTGLTAWAPGSARSRQLCRSGRRRPGPADPADAQVCDAPGQRDTDAHRPRPLRQVAHRVGPSEVGQAEDREGSSWHQADGNGQPVGNALSSDTVRKTISSQVTRPTVALTARLPGLTCIARSRHPEARALWERPPPRPSRRVAAETPTE